MGPEQVVLTGEFKMARNAGLLVARGVGSCVVACLWDQARKLGGMAHIPMPSSSLDVQEAAHSPGLYADTALVGLLLPMERRGARREHMSVRLAGAGNMFEGCEVGFMGQLPTGILTSVTEVLRTLGLHVAAQSVGGAFGRSVFFDVGSGAIEVKLTNGKRVLL
ncbi:chemotaxis protein CheD [Megalodesulfovibrio gigas]|uniref:Probable chemoreceptor glutamine deamidase CheD n=1 Tax=Megalodesulfovibrio gigas (strain ATCC 19364 / DSM 1382 / NCIMB 9332 / VKM B-1759) TaxID=1121448 RepID=T2GG46_MEGG1|nr:chemotaxis protein CheD [Megalodesulfovibrio gigas]AGW14952.1 putative chemoreceptor glutamine deamidase CheD [Megalodesulfovibrio gigas DSM 1382 = ATCC 19364]